MHALGFNNKWCDLIYRLISNCWYSVLWDGSSFGHFKSFQSVRQGDPISPSLFIISTECLSRLLKQRINEGYILPYFVKVGALHVMLVFTNSSKASLTRLMELFNNLCAWSGQQLNAGKSSLFLDKNVSPQRRRTILDITGFTSGSFPTTYLGAPLFSRRVKIEYFSALEEKVRCGIGEWVRKFIYMAGRVTIIEVVLNSTLIHTLASLPTPQAVLDRISSLLSSFLWDSNADSRHHWIGWRDVCRPKVAGGLGITHLETIKMSLQYKLAWHSMSSPLLWGKFVRSRYIDSRAGSHMWNVIRMQVAQLKGQAKWLLGQGTTLVGDFCWHYNVAAPPELHWSSIKDAAADHNHRLQILNILPKDGKMVMHNFTPTPIPDDLTWLCRHDGVLSSKAIKDRISHPQGLDLALSKIWKR
ncbi:hypothetical protein QQ045_018594 [Rhodiola kirilowii]